MSAQSSGSLAAATTAFAAVLTDLGTKITTGINWLPGYTAYLMIAIMVVGALGYIGFRIRDDLMGLYSTNTLRRAVGLPPILPKYVTPARVLTLVHSTRPASRIKNHPNEVSDQHAV